jgi:hypothetical protein
MYVHKLLDEAPGFPAFRQSFHGTASMLRDIGALGQGYHLGAAEAE